MTRLLPDGIDLDAVRSDVDRGRLLMFFRRFVEQRFEQYGHGHWIFASYAAVPALLTPDLLYRIWVNFASYQTNETIRHVHRVAVPDVLLSSLCREVGQGLYEMLPNVRNGLLSWLRVQTKPKADNPMALFSPETIARFVLEYFEQLPAAQERWGNGYSEAQTWNAYSFFDLEKTQRLLLDKLRKASDNAEKVRVLEILQKTERQISVLFSVNELKTAVPEFLQISTFAAGWSDLIQQNPDAFIRKIEENPALLTYLEEEKSEGALEVQIEIEPNQASRLQAIAPSTVFSIIIGIDYYLGGLSPLKGCVRDAKAFSAFLESYTTGRKQRYNSIFLLNEQATQENVLSESYNLFGQARNGDVCVFYFAGHATKDTNERQLILYDSKGDKPEGLSQKYLEEHIYPLLADKAVHCLCIFDTDNFRYPNFQSSLRQNVQKLKGSLIVLNATQPGRFAQETEIGGIFTNALIAVLNEGSVECSYRALMEKVRLRVMQTSGGGQMPEWEAFPAYAADYRFLSDQIERKNTYHIAFAGEEWRLLSGYREGIRPSLNFMHTYLRLNDGSKVIVKDVFLDYATIFETPKLDTGKTYEAKLIQNALPKIPIAFDPSLPTDMREEFEWAVLRHEIYFIDLVEDKAPAKFIIGTRNIESDVQSKASSNTIYGKRDFGLFRKDHIVPRDRSSTFKPVFGYVRDPFEFIKQIEYIAQWTGVLEYDNPGSLNKNCINVKFEIIEGQVIKMDTINFMEGIPAKDSDIVTLNYKMVNGNWRKPALRCRVTSGDTDQPLYIQALFLSSGFGIILLEGGKLPQPELKMRDIVIEKKNPGITINLLINNDSFNALPLTIPKHLYEEEPTESIDYLKIIVSDKPLDLSPLAQESLKFEATATRKGIDIDLRERNGVDFAGVEWVSRVFPIRLVKARTEASPPESGTPQPPEQKIAIHPLQWHLKKTSINGKIIDAHIHVEEAWRTTRGGSVTVAVIGDGVDVKHPEFKGKIVAPYDSKYNVEDARPQSAEENTSTALAGLICAAGIDSAGVAPEAKLMPIRMQSDLGSMAEANAITWAADHGAGVLVLEYGPTDGAWWDPDDPRHLQNTPLPESTRRALEYALNRGRDGKGMAICIGAGNGNENIETNGYASYSNLIAVAACNDNGTRSVYSDFGKNVWCCAPSGDFGWEPMNHQAPQSEGIRTTDRTGTAGYEEDAYVNSFGGTQGAVAIAAGVIALVLAANPDLRWEEVKKVIKNSCDKIDPENGQYDAEGHSIYYGYGRVNAARAVQYALDFARQPV